MVHKFGIMENAFFIPGTACFALLHWLQGQSWSLLLYSVTVCSGTDQRKHHILASLAFVRGIHWWPVHSPHKGPIMWKMFYLMTSSYVFLPLTHWHIKHFCASWSIIVSSRGFGPAYWCSALEKWDTKDARTDCSFVDEEILTDVTIVTCNISMLKLCHCIDIMILIHPNCLTHHS